MAQRLDRLAAAAREAAELLREVAAEQQALSGDKVEDFNDRWGGAGPDCVCAPA